MSVLWVAILGISVFTLTTIRDVGPASPIPGTRWTPRCDQYTHTYGKVPLLRILKRLGYAATSSCRQVCTDRVDCGGFTSWSDDTCNIYGISDRVIREHWNGSADDWYADIGFFANVDWYSKTCDYDMGHNRTACNIYDTHKHEGVGLWYDENEKWAVAALQITTFSKSQCLQLCTLHAACRSVTYNEKDIPFEKCALYSTTIDDTSTLRIQHGYYTTYDRYCPDGNAYYYQAQTCPGPNSDKYNENGNCYWKNDTPATFSQAEATYVSHGGHLTSIHDYDELRYVRGVAGTKEASHSYWTGLHDPGGKCRGNRYCDNWQFTDGSTYNSSALGWQTDEPSGDGNCVVMAGKYKRLEDVGCETTNHFVCKKDIDECLEGWDYCHSDATCVNTEGAYICENNLGTAAIIGIVAGYVPLIAVLAAAAAVYLLYEEEGTWS